jgi:hypothetical protein
MSLRERLKKEQDRKRSKWPTKRFADGSLWRLHPKTEEPVERLEPPDPEKGWKETRGHAAGPGP